MRKTRMEKFLHISHRGQMGNASRRPRSMVHVRVQQQQQQQQSAVATPSRDISGFVKDNGYALEFVLRAEKATAPLSL